jgi:hypothetical protein
MIGRDIISMVYGIDIKPRDDPYVKAAETVMHHVATEPLSTYGILVVRPLLPSFLSIKTLP